MLEPTPPVGGGQAFLQGESGCCRSPARPRTASRAGGARRRPRSPGTGSGSTRRSGRPARASSAASRSLPAAYSRIVSCSRKHGDAPDVLPGHQRLVDQRRQQVQRRTRVVLPDAQTASSVVQGEPAGEHAEPAQQPLLCRGQQVVTPVDGRPQRLLPRQGRPAAAGEQREPIRQPVQDLLAVTTRESGRRRARWPAAARPAAGTARRRPHG